MKRNYEYLLSDLSLLKGVGTKTSNLLKRKKVNTIFDLLWKLPKSYTDRTLSSKIKDLKIDPSKVNLDGGALALGHPLGATGARITGKVAQLLKRENKKYALASQCIGLGMGIATIIESVD